MIQNGKVFLRSLQEVYAKKMKDPALTTAQGFSWKERQMMEAGQTAYFSAPENGLF